MHPAFSVIVFTTASGAGYGLLALLGLFAALGLLPPDRWLGFAAFALALGAVTVGLLASMLHLGRPERAWRSFSQWRSSWLSREGVAAVVTYAPALLFAAGWILLQENAGWWTLAGLASVAMAAVTVWCTAMIYASLTPIQRWANRWVAPNYLLLAAMTGALLLHAILRLFAVEASPAGWVALVAIAGAALGKIGYWRYIDGTKSVATAESATGLGGIGKVRLLEAPHTEENYLMREMGFRIARKHARKLRFIALIVGFALPFVLTLAGLAAATLPSWIAATAAVLAAISGLLGVLVERWLFFAEAKHAVTLYYGASTA
jgi:DMSO reductase anchor subunit